eukprot:357578-Chlamydomonas_euryale.AAC.2
MPFLGLPRSHRYIECQKGGLPGRYDPYPQVVWILGLPGRLQLAILQGSLPGSTRGSPSVTGRRNVQEGCETSGRVSAEGGMGGIGHPSGDSARECRQAQVRYVKGWAVSGRVREWAGLWGQGSSKW